MNLISMVIKNLKIKTENDKLKFKTTNDKFKNNPKC